MSTRKPENEETANPAFSETQLIREPTAGLGRPGRVRQFLSITTILLISLGGVWAGFAWYIGHQALLIGDLILIMIGIVTWFLLRFGRLLFAIHWALLTLLIWIPTIAFFISGSGVNHNGAVHYWLIVYIVGLYFVLFDSARAVQTFYIAFAILLFIVIEYDLVSLSPEYGFPEHDTLFSHGLTLGLVLIAISVMMRRFIRELGEAERAARNANIRSRQLLESVLPPSVVQRVEKAGVTYTQRTDECTILFADIVGFTPLASELPAEKLVGLLNDVFSAFDALAEKRGVEKIKTIGDGYMAACGIPSPCQDHAGRVLRLAMDMQHAMDAFPKLSIRIGVNSGPAVAGIIGRSRIAFDLWGEAVNLASRMESHGENDRIQVSAATAELTRDMFRYDEGRVIEVKGKGAMQVYFLLGTHRSSTEEAVDGARH